MKKTIMWIAIYLSGVIASYLMLRKNIIDNAIYHGYAVKYSTEDRVLNIGFSMAGSWFSFVTGAIIYGVQHSNIDAGTRASW